MAWLSGPWLQALEFWGHWSHCLVHVVLSHLGRWRVSVPESGVIAATLSRVLQESGQSRSAAAASLGTEDLVPFVCQGPGASRQQCGRLGRLGCPAWPEYPPVLLQRRPGCPYRIPEVPGAALRATREKVPQLRGWSWEEEGGNLKESPALCKWLRGRRLSDPDNRPGHSTQSPGGRRRSWAPPET